MPVGTSTWVSSSPAGRALPSGVFTRLMLAWNSGVRLRSRGSAMASSTRSNGASWCAKASRAWVRTRPSSSTKDGMPDSRERKGRVLMKHPISISSSGRVRPAMGVPTTKSSCPE
nr:hypothetical protein [Corallococcus sp. CA049B]